MRQYDSSDDYDSYDYCYDSSDDYDSYDSSDDYDSKDPERNKIS